jgi:hypothetical protein
MSFNSLKMRHMCSWQITLFIMMTGGPAMFTLEALSNKIADYRHGLLPIGEFEEWFEDHATADAYDDPELHEVCVAIRAAFAEFQFDGIGADEMKEELANAVRPFVLLEHRFVVVRPPRGMSLDQGDLVGTRATFVVGTNSQLENSDWEAPMLAAS